MKGFKRRKLQPICENGGCIETEEGALWLRLADSLSVESPEEMRMFLMELRVACRNIPHATLESILQKCLVKSNVRACLPRL